MEIKAAGRVKAGVLEAGYSSHGVNFDAKSGRIVFPNNERHGYTALVSNSAEEPYITTTHWVAEFGPNYIVVKQHALDTGGAGRTFPASDFTFAIIIV
ncbi:MAG TPA: hypothetical protein VFB45_04665 [Pseudolabrys sp.]|nr:hypothetical protein [Pseudolabrys sp.]